MYFSSSSHLLSSQGSSKFVHSWGGDHRIWYPWGISRRVYWRLCWWSSLRTRRVSRKPWSFLNYFGFSFFFFFWELFLLISQRKRGREDMCKLFDYFFNYWFFSAELPFLLPLNRGCCCTCWCSLVFYKKNNLILEPRLFSCWPSIFVHFGKVNLKPKEAGNQRMILLAVNTKKEMSLILKYTSFSLIILNLKVV